MTIQERTDLVAYFVREREAVRIRKANGSPQPWTKDPVIGTYRFTNVRREDDRVTQWIRYHWRNPYHDHRNLTLAMAMARFVNWPPALEELGFPKRWDPRRFVKVMQGRKVREEKCWNPAYMISTCGAESDKAEHVAAVLNRLSSGHSSPLGADTLEMAHGRLTRIFGLGNFLAGQIIADLKHVHSNPLAKAQDWWTWAAPGPGSERGLRWWLGREKPVPEYEFLPRLTDLWQEVGPLVKDIGPLHMQDVQNVCCEVSKIVKVQAGGRLKQKYQTTAEAYTV